MHPSTYIIASDEFMMEKQCKGTKNIEEEVSEVEEEELPFEWNVKGFCR